MTHYDPEKTAARETPLTESLIKYASGQYDVAIVQTLSLPNVGLANLDALEHCQMLTSLDVSCNFLRGPLPKFDATTSALCTTLKFLDLSHNELDNIEAITSLRGVEVLRLEANLLDSLDAVMCVTAMPKLRRVYFDKNPFVAKSPKYREALLSASTTLRCVDGEYLAAEGQALRRERERVVECGLEDIVIPPSKPWIRDDFFERTLTEPSQVQLSEEKNFRAVVNEFKRLLEHAEGMVEKK
eukprot:PhM_4_TR9603/c0_g1_i1/m.93792